MKCIYRNTPTPSPSPERDAEFVESEEEAEPSGRCAAPSELVSTGVARSPNIWRNSRAPRGALHYIWLTAINTGCLAVKLLLHEAGKEAKLSSRCASVLSRTEGFI